MLCEVKELFRTEHNVDSLFCFVYVAHNIVQLIYQLGSLYKEYPSIYLPEFSYSLISELATKIQHQLGSNLGFDIIKNVPKFSP